MGSPLISLEEAARRLGRSKRSVQYYLENGLLRRILQDGHARVYREDVESLAADLDAPRPALTRKAFFVVLARMKRLEEQMAIVSQLVGFDRQPLKLDPDSARALLAAAKAALGAKEWFHDEITLWISQFVKLDDLAMDSIATATSEPNPWTIFFRLCTQMVKQVQNKEPLDDKLLVGLLDARRKLREVAILWVEMGRGSTQETILGLLGSNREALLRGVLGRKAKKPSS